MHNEQKLITGCIKGDINFQRQLFERFSGKMLVICLRYSKDEHEAKDIMMDGFLKVYDNIGKFRQECPLEAWIYRIMVNTALKHYRRKNKIYPILDIEEANNQSVDEEVMPNYGYQELLEMIQTLPQRYSVVFNLYVVDGYSHKEIAEMLDIPEGTSKSNLSRARIMLQERIRIKEKKNNERSV